MSERLRARSWVAHLRGGGTTPWHAYEPATDVAVPPGAPALPGAVQLEALRRLNVSARGAAVPPDLVAAVLGASGPGRGHPDRSLVGVGDGSRFGPPPADPARLEPGELLRLVVGVLADEAVAADPGPGPADPPAPVPWRRDHRLVGDPLLAGATRTALADARHRRGLRGPVVLVLADDLGGFLADLWRWRVTRGVTPAWEWWVSHWARRDRLPPRAELGDVAARWADRVGRDRVHVILGPDPAPEVGRLLGGPVGSRRPLAAAYDGPSVEATELLRHLNGVLRVLVERRPHQQVLDRVLLPALAGETGPPRALPPELLDWVRGRAERLRTELTRGGYPVRGDLAALLPAAGAGGGPTDEAVLDLALRTLLGVRGAGG